MDVIAHFEGVVMGELDLRLETSSAAEYAANTLEELIDGSSAHGYTTVGIPSGDFTINELFERDGDWNRSVLAALINDGLIDADSETGALELRTRDKTNNATIRATALGGLDRRRPAGCPDQKHIAGRSLNQQ